MQDFVTIIRFLPCQMVRPTHGNREGKGLGMRRMLTPLTSPDPESVFMVVVAFQIPSSLFKRLAETVGGSLDVLAKLA
jgi:hypothetical protein